MLKKVSLIALLFSSVNAAVVNSIWTGTSSNDWLTVSNWNPQSIPQAAGDIANFSSPSANTNPHIPSSIFLGTLNFSDPATSYTISAATEPLFEAVPATNNAFINIAANTATNTLSTGIGLNSPVILTQNASNPFILNGGIQGTQNLTIQGTGVVYLDNVATMPYTGLVTINSGALQIPTSLVLGINQNATINNGTLLFTSTDNNMLTIATGGNATVQSNMALTLNGVISGNGSVTFSGSAPTTLTATNTYMGGTTISGVQVNVTTESNLGDPMGSLNLNNGILELANGFTTNRSGTITASSTIQASPNTTNTFNGNFNGSGSLTFQQTTPGVTTQFVLSGSNSYTGGTFVDNGTFLIGTTQSLQRNITLPNDATSALIFQQDFDGTYSGSLSGGPMTPMNLAQLEKFGIGKVTFTASSPFIGQTQIVEGSLIINGSLQSSNAFVDAGATLGGLGSIGAVSVFSMGILDPGDGLNIGPLRINGDLTLDPNATTRINIDTNSADKIIVVGNAPLDGALIIDPIPGFYGFIADYQILTASNVSQQFTLISSTNPAFRPTVTQTLTDVKLHLDIAPFATFPFSNQNTRAVGHNADAIFAAGQMSLDLYNIFKGFVGKSVRTIDHVLNQIHAAPYSALTEMQAEVNGQLISLFHRLPYLSCCCDNPNRFWIQGLGNSLTVKEHGIEIGFQANTGGIALGYDGKINDSLILGFGGAWTDNHLHWKHERGHSKSNSLYGSLYFDSQVGCFYFGGTFLGGIDFYTTSRNIDFLTTHRQALAQFQSLELMGQIRTAYLFGAPQVYFYPYFNLDSLYQNTRKFSESNASSLNLNLFNRTDITLRSEVGLALQVQDRNYAETVCISPLVSIGYVNMTPLERPLLKSTFQGARIPFKVLGFEKTWHLMNLDFGLTFSYRCFSLLLDYNVEFSCDSKQTFYNQHGDFHLDWKW